MHVQNKQAYVCCRWVKNIQHELLWFPRSVDETDSILGGIITVVTGNGWIPEQTFHPSPNSSSHWTSLKKNTYYTTEKDRWTSQHTAKTANPINPCAKQLTNRLCETFMFSVFNVRGISPGVCMSCNREVCVSVLVWDLLRGNSKS